MEKEISLHNKTLRQCIAEIDKLSSLRSEELNKKGVKSSLLKILLMPKIEFLINWKVKLKFLSTEKFVEIILSSFCSFLTWSKLWLLQKSEKNS